LLRHGWRGTPRLDLQVPSLLVRAPLTHCPYVMGAVPSSLDCIDDSKSSSKHFIPYLTQCDFVGHASCCRYRKTLGSPSPVFQVGRMPCWSRRSQDPLDATRRWNPCSLSLPSHRPGAMSWPTRPSVWCVIIELPRRRLMHPSAVALLSATDTMSTLQKNARAFFTNPSTHTSGAYRHSHDQFAANPCHDL
jgi:hypothetical protein